MYISTIQVIRGSLVAYHCVCVCCVMMMLTVNISMVMNVYDGGVGGGDCC